MTTIQIKHGDLKKTNFDNVQELSEYLFDLYVDFKFTNLSDLSFKQRLEAEKFDPNQVDPKRLFNV